MKIHYYLCYIDVVIFRRIEKEQNTIEGKYEGNADQAAWI